MRIFSWILLLLIITAAVQAQSARQYFKAGEDFARANNYTDAIIQFTKAIELDPDYDKAYILRATAYSRTGDHRQAAEDYDRALAFNEKEAELYYFSGKEWHQYGDNPRALIRLSSAINLKNNFLEAYQVRRDVYVVLRQYEKALDDGKKCLKMKEDDKAYFSLARIYEHLEMYNEAEEAYRYSIQKNRRVVDTHFLFARLLYQRGKFEAAGNEVTQVLQMEPRHLEGILLQSQVYSEQGEYLKASETLSMASVHFSDEPLIFLFRGDIASHMNQAGYAIIDYSKAIELDPKNAEVYYKRAVAYEKIRDYENALADYNKILAMSGDDGDTRSLHEEATRRMFELNREENKPVVTLIDPQSNEANIIHVSREVAVLNLSGGIADESDIQSLQVNGFNVPVQKTGEGCRFLASVDLSNTNQLTVQVSDIYDNTETAIFPIRRTEIDPPVVRMIAPYGSESNILYLDNNDPMIYVEGKIEDESKISSIYIDSVIASYIPSDLNPNFTATLNVRNKSSITVHVEDEFGNRSRIKYSLNRDAQSFDSNPMGKTWAIFIENSDYESFSSLTGPGNDVTLMRSALANYQIHNVIHKKNMSKAELSKFFSIELRDMIRSNRVNSLLIWYAGHGKYVNGSGYWIPVDASRDDEFSFYNTNALKAAMQVYPDFLTHTLVITDACESGPGFYQAMRSGIQERSCDDWTSTRFKSSQVFSSAGYEQAVDDSQFTRTFANMLINNPGACVPIENIVLKVRSAVENINRQSPQFGKIAGLEDENGTFFFIPKEY
ncbi:MAG: tetratricopeptide repeat protein [Bacteroidales bacterium]|nr:tetratricopeptide repeat protein [Bacteroidales bacterium]